MGFSEYVKELFGDIGTGNYIPSVKDAGIYAALSALMLFSGGCKKDRFDYGNLAVGGTYHVSDAWVRYAEDVRTGKAKDTYAFLDVCGKDTVRQSGNGRAAKIVLCAGSLGEARKMACRLEGKDIQLTHIERSAYRTAHSGELLYFACLDDVVIPRDSMRGPNEGCCKPVKKPSHRPSSHGRKVHAKPQATETVGENPPCPEEPATLTKTSPPRGNTYITNNYYIRSGPPGRYVVSARRPFPVARSRLRCHFQYY